MSDQVADATDSSQEMTRRTSTVSGEHDGVGESLATPSVDQAQGAGEWREAEAFASVHDLVHHAIVSQSSRRSATLRQIYATCEQKGRIAYKHGKGSRLITANEHWKSQIRHALYTSPRFARVNGGENWSVSNKNAPDPKTTTVRVHLSGDGDSASEGSGGRCGGSGEGYRGLISSGNKAGAGAGDGKTERKAGAVPRAHTVQGEVSSPTRAGKKRTRGGKPKPSSTPDLTSASEGHASPVRRPLAEVAALADTVLRAVDSDEDGGSGSPKCGLRRTDSDLKRRAAGERVRQQGGHAASAANVKQKQEEAKVVVMVGSKAVVPKARDPSFNRRKPSAGHRAPMPAGSSVSMSPARSGSHSGHGMVAIGPVHTSAFVTYHSGVQTKTNTTVSGVGTDTGKGARPEPRNSSSADAVSVRTVAAAAAAVAANTVDGGGTGTWLPMSPKGVVLSSGKDGDEKPMGVVGVSVGLGMSVGMGMSFSPVG